MVFTDNSISSTIKHLNTSEIKMADFSPFLMQCPVLQYYFVDKDNAEALGGGIVTFYEDNNRTVKKPVYQVTESPGPIFTYTELSNPLQLSSAGTFVDESGSQILIYLYPYQGSPTDSTPSGVPDLYYIDIYSSSGVHQQTITSFPSGITSSTSALASATDNLITNPQFSSVSFNSQSSCMITVTASPQVTPIAPGWDLVTNGTGTVTIQQNPISQTDIPSNPPYSLNISSSGISAPLVLRQRFYSSPRLLVSNYVSGYFVVRSSTFVTPVTLSYQSSSGTPNNFNIVTINTTADGIWHDTTGLTSTVQIDPTTISTDAPPAGYVDIEITIAPNVQVEISSVQIAGVASANISQAFFQQPVPLEEDHLFHYYKNSILRQPKETILTGWNFPLNPWQFQTTAKTIIATNQYVADQTILLQQNYVSAASGSNVQSGQSGFASNNALQITSVTANNQFAIVQYIDPLTISPYWGKTLSSMVKAYITTVNSTSCHIKMRLIYRATLPSTVSQTEPLASWSAGQDPVLSSGWTYIVPQNDPKYLLGSTTASYQFNSMVLPPSTATTMTLAIMLYTVDNMSIAGTPDSIQIDSISLVANDFAVDCGPQTPDKVLLDCQRFYQKSFLPGQIPAQNIGAQTGESYGIAATTTGTNGPIIRFPVPMFRSPGTVTLYNPQAANSQIRDLTNGNDWSASTANSNTITQIGFQATGTPTSTSAGDRLGVHWIADGRLGVSP